ncbi:VWA domain-containing protein [Francisella philomiragia]|uniref:von Willebrand factor type A domain protein n=1 Tax=Francisella philomiragia TaxID=28110 RepID=A0AAW3DBH6_9GAMM|nr:VWA domain-containing protein [Francisella philomiragia]KFJ42527.1 von Willebrand factor type A domain protein [Francisella philomiragia]MBK2253850.1 VWA domain-containing protein [Francisella philomiragia]MBK2272162.1 VWA domain-containing protein [Francisella philomiragia]MBK2276004.1 VWA domain-containing protein [Francisella philomiragia]MBK2279951.1 VWA domain-containing protein [Francisella philomiragia]
MDFHFLRPWWLLALIPIVVFVILLFRSSSQANSWAKYCDSHLLEHVVVGKQSKTKKSLVPFLFLCLWIVSVVALAGPTWKYKDVPVYQENVSRVIALDVSQSMDTTDVSPTRLERAKYKTLDILRRIKEGQVGMIVFSSEPFVVSPLTSDANTVENLVPVINSDIVPVQGNNIYKAIEKSAQLITQAGAKKGQIILITDSTPSADAIAKAKQLAEQGIDTDVYAIGTPKGGIAKDDRGNYIKDDGGNIQYFGIDLNQLEALAKAGSGKLVTLTANNTDVKKLLSDTQGNGKKKSDKKSANIFWQDEGIYFIWLLVAMSLLFFRRGILERICR